MSRQSTGLSRDERTGFSGGDAFTVEEFAVLNRISRSQAYKEIAAGRLTARKLGTRTIITAEDGQRWRESLPKMVPAAQHAIATTA